MLGQVCTLLTVLESFGSKLFTFNQFGKFLWLFGQNRLLNTLGVIKICSVQGVSCVSRDQILNVEHRCIGFMLILSVIFVKSWKIGIFLVHFWDFSLFLKDYLFITILWAREWAPNLYTCILHLLLDSWTTLVTLEVLV